MNKTIKTKYYKIIIHVLIISFIATNSYAFNRISPTGTFTEDPPPAMDIANFLLSEEKMNRSINMRNQMLNNINRQIDYGYQRTVNDRVADNSYVNYQIAQGASINNDFAVNESSGVNEDGSTWKSYSGKSIVQVKGVLQMIGFSGHYGEISSLCPKDSRYSWSIVLNYQQGDSGRIKFKFVINDDAGLSRNSFAIVREKIFSEDDDEDEFVEDVGEVEVIEIDDEEDLLEPDGEFYWVDKKIIQTNIVHTTDSKSYANKGTEAHDFITSLHEVIYYLNNNKVLERDVEREYDEENKVMVKEYSINYEYDRVIGNKDTAHIYEITREMEPDGYIKSPEGEWLLSEYKETIIDNRAPDKITTKFVEILYDEEDKIKQQISAIHEESNSGLDRWYTVVENNFSYMSVYGLDLNQIQGYSSIQINGDFNSKDETLEITRELAELDLDNINPDKLGIDGIRMQIQNIDHIKYDTEGQQKHLEGYTKTVGKDGLDVIDYQYDFVQDILEYDEMGRVVSRREEITNDTTAPDKITTTTISDIEYDDKGVQLSYFQEITEDGDGINHSMTLTREGITYNGSGQVVSYVDTTWDSSSPDKTAAIVTTDIQYNEDGLQEAYFQEINEEGPGLDRITTLIREGIVYNSLNQTIAYTDITNDSSSPDKTTILITSDIKYNEDGLKEAYFQEITEQGPGLDHTITLQREEVLYNDLGQTIAYVDITDDSSAPDKTTTIIVDNIKYNEDGLKQAYFQEITEEGPGLDHTTTLERGDMSYNDLGQTDAYTDVTWDSGAPDKTTTVSVGDIKYNEDGLQEAYFQEITEEGPRLDKTTTIERKNITYNSLGQIISYTDVIETSDGVTITDVTNIVYDENGLKISYTETTEYDDGGSRVADVKLTYDGNGRIKTREEEGHEKGENDEGESYDRDFYRHITYTYDEYSRVIKEEIDSWDSENSDMNVHIVREILSFNGLGQATSIHTVMNIDGPNTGSAWKNKENIKYDINGEEESADETQGGDFKF